MGHSEGTSPEIFDFWCANESRSDSSTPVETALAVDTPVSAKRVVEAGIPTLKERTSTELRRSRRRRMGHRGVPWSVRRYTGRVDGSTDRTQEPRSVEVVFQPQRERRSQRQTRLLGQRRRRARASDVHPQHIVHCRVGRILPTRNSRWTRLERRVRPGIPRTAQTRNSGRPQLEAVRQAGSVRVVLRRTLGPIQGLSASHRGQFSTGTTTGRGIRRSGYRCEQPRRLYNNDRTAVPLRRPRSVRTVPRDNTRDRTVAVVARRRSVQLETHSTPVPSTDAKARPRTSRTVPRPDRTAVRRGRVDSVCRESHGRTRHPLVGRNEREDAQFLGVSSIRETTLIYSRGVRHLGRGSVGSMDQPRVPAVWVDRPNDTPPRYTDVSVWLRGTRRSGSEPDVPETSPELFEFWLANETRSVSSTADRCSKADGTARMPQVGRPPMVGVTTLSPSQRGAYEPASCLRGSVNDTPSERKPRRCRAAPGCKRDRRSRPVYGEEGVIGVSSADMIFSGPSLVFLHLRRDVPMTTQRTQASDGLQAWQTRPLDVFGCNQ